MIWYIGFALLLIFYAWMASRPSYGPDEDVLYRIGFANWAELLWRVGAASMVLAAIAIGALAEGSSLGFPRVEAYGIALTAGALGVLMYGLRRRMDVIVTDRGIYYGVRFLPWEAAGTITFRNGIAEVHQPSSEKILMRLGGPGYDLHHEDLKRIEELRPGHVSAQSCHP